MTNTKNMSCSIKLNLFRQIDAERGAICRSRFVNDLLEYALREKSTPIGKDGRLSQ